MGQGQTSMSLQHAKTPRQQRTTNCRNKNCKALGIDPKRPNWQLQNHILAKPYRRAFSHYKHYNDAQWTCKLRTTNRTNKTQTQWQDPATMFHASKFKFERTQICITKQHLAEQKHKTSTLETHTQLIVTTTQTCTTKNCQMDTHNDTTGNKNKFLRIKRGNISFHNVKLHIATQNATNARHRSQTKVTIHAKSRAPYHLSCNVCLFVQNCAYSNKDMLTRMNATTPRVPHKHTQYNPHTRKLPWRAIIMWRPENVAIDVKSLLQCYNAHSELENLNLWATQSLSVQVLPTAPLLDVWQTL